MLLHRTPLPTGILGARRDPLQTLDNSAPRHKRSALGHSHSPQRRRPHLLAKPTRPRRTPHLVLAELERALLRLLLLCRVPLPLLLLLLLLPPFAHEPDMRARVAWQQTWGSLFGLNSRTCRVRRAALPPRWWPLPLPRAPREAEQRAEWREGAASYRAAPGEGV